MQTVFFGASNYILPVIEVLRKDFNLKHVFTTENEKNEAVIKYCLENKTPYTSTHSPANLQEKYEKLNLDASVGIVADFGVIIPRALLELFPHGIINIHPSLLPKFRGPTPVQTTLLENEKTTGVTIIKLDEFMDHGPIIASDSEIISPEDTSKSLLEILFKKGALMLKDTLPFYLKGEINLAEQNHKEATFTKMLKREDGFIKLNSFPHNEKLEQMIKAYYPWPGVWTKAILNENGQEKIIKFLPFRKLQVEGRRDMSYKDFLNGYPNISSVLRLFLEKNV